MNYGQYAQMALRSTIDPCAENVRPYAFISYRRTDAPKERFTFIGSLKEAGFRYWYDDSIPVLSDWKEKLETAVGNSSLFIALITKNYYRSYQCLKEMRQAINEGKTIFLFSLDRTPLYSPINKGDEAITLRDSETNDSVTISQSDIEKYITWRNHLDLKDQLRDGVFQLSALTDKLASAEEFRVLMEE